VRPMGEREPSGSAGPSGILGLGFGAALMIAVASLVPGHGVQYLPAQGLGATVSEVNVAEVQQSTRVVIASRVALPGRVGVGAARFPALRRRTTATSSSGAAGNSRSGSMDCLRMCQRPERASTTPRVPDGWPAPERGNGGDAPVRADVSQRTTSRHLREFLESGVLPSRTPDRPARKHTRLACSRHRPAIADGPPAGRQQRANPYWLVALRSSQYFLSCSV